MQFDFGDILSRAWQIIWRYKVLWIFGILASCGRGGGGGDFGFDGSPQDFGRDLPEFLQFLQDVPPENYLVVISLIVVGLVCLSLILSVVFFAIRTVGRLGLIQGTLFAEAGAESLGFMQLIDAGRPYFWRVLLLNFLIGVAALILGVVIAIPAVVIAFVTFGLGLLCLIPLLLLLIPVGWFVQVIVEQANVALVVEDLDIIGSLQKGWDVVRNNWAPAIVMGLILFIARFVVGLIIALPVLVALGPLFAGIIGGGISESTELIFGGVAVTLLCICALLPILLAIGGAIESYVGSAWTLTYLRLTGHEPELPALEAGAA